jgi:bacterioferritin-associated ferredoxin
MQRRELAGRIPPTMCEVAELAKLLGIGVECGSRLCEAGVIVHEQGTR